jgi:hypothetical protein
MTALKFIVIFLCAITAAVLLGLIIGFMAAALQELLKKKSRYD